MIGGDFSHAAQEPSAQVFYEVRDPIFKPEATAAQWTSPTRSAADFCYFRRAISLEGQSAWRPRDRSRALWPEPQRPDHSPPCVPAPSVESTFLVPHASPPTLKPVDFCNPCVQSMTKEHSVFSCTTVFLCICVHAISVVVATVASAHECAANVRHQR